MKIKKVIFYILLISILGYILFNINFNLENKSEKEDVSAWVVDWDLDNGLDEIKDYNLSSVQLFASYFDEDGNLFLPEKLIHFIENENKSKINEDLYITVVNDVIKKDGSSIQKDNKVISAILLDRDRRSSHINNLVDLVCDGRFVGLDLDYEKIDDNLWEEYSSFIDALGKKLSEKEKKLRVILEPRSPIDKVSLPKEYEYVMMAYNLYGYHSGPGPKADISFINDLCKSVNDNLENVRIAFSLGGFDWCEGEKTKALTYVDVNQLVDKLNVDIKIDDSSKALYFSYVDENGKKHSVWYSNDETIKSWKEVAKKNNINKFALWRLGKSI